MQNEFVGRFSLFKALLVNLVVVPKFLRFNFSSGTVCLHRKFRLWQIKWIFFSHDRPLGVPGETACDLSLKLKSQRFGAGSSRSTVPAPYFPIIIIAAR